jgi:hypothetical protein
LSTRTVKTTEPLGSRTVSGDAVFATVRTGATPVTVTVALSLSLTGVPSSSAPEAVTVSVGVSPALPETWVLNEQL